MGSGDIVNYGSRLVVKLVSWCVVKNLIKQYLASFEKAFGLC